MTALTCLTARSIPSPTLRVQARASAPHLAPKWRCPVRDATHLARPPCNPSTSAKPTCFGTYPDPYVATMLYTPDLPPKAQILTAPRATRRLTPICGAASEIVSMRSV